MRSKPKSRWTSTPRTGLPCKHKTLECTAMFVCPAAVRTHCHESSCHIIIMCSALACIQPSGYCLTHWLQRTETIFSQMQN